MNGMLIGYRGGLSDEMQKAFSDAGLLHIMAVSGANVAFLAAPLAFLLKLMRIRKKGGKSYNHWVPESFSPVSPDLSRRSRELCVWPAYF